MNVPQDFDSLLKFLEDRPSVQYHGTEPSGEIVDEERTFLEYRQGGLWFLRRNGVEKRFCPIQCGLVSASSGVRYKPDGFTVTMFGLTNTFTYLLEGKMGDKKNDQSKRTADVELLTVSRILRMLGSLPDDASRLRVFNYLKDRFAPIFAAAPQQPEK